MKSTQFPADATDALTSAVGIRRYVNDEVARVAHRFDPDHTHRFEFLCECGRLACGGTVGLQAVVTEVLMVVTLHLLQEKVCERRHED
jgi:hypothetical protein